MRFLSGPDEGRERRSIDRGGALPVVSQPPPPPQGSSALPGRFSARTKEPRGAHAIVSLRSLSLLLPAAERKRRWRLKRDLAAVLGESGLHPFPHTPHPIFAVMTCSSAGVVDRLPSSQKTRYSQIRVFLFCLYPQTGVSLSLVFVLFPLPPLTYLV